MNACENAIVVAADAAAYPLTLVQRPEVGGRVRRDVLAFLAALPPSIVVDGRVVELEDAMVVLCRGPKTSLVVQAMVEGLTNAAREVAGREGN